MEIKIHQSVTPEQQRDERFQNLLNEAQGFFDSPANDHYKLMLGLHEAGHAYFARRAGATDIRYYGPTMYWDSRPQYNCPAISKSAVDWTPGGSAVANLKAFIGGYICRRELTDKPNDHIAIESDLDGAWNWYKRNIGTSREAFQKAIEEAERELVKDLRSPAVRRAIWNEAHRFAREIFGEPEPEQVLSARAILFG